MKRKVSILLATVLAFTMMIGMSMTAMAYSYTINYGTPETPRYLDSGIVQITDSTGAYFKVSSPSTITVKQIFYINEVEAANNTNTIEGHIPTRIGIWNRAYFDSIESELASLLGYVSIKPAIRMVWRFNPDNTPSGTVEWHFYTTEYYDSHFGTGDHEHHYEWRTISEPTMLCDGLEGEVCTICGEYGHIEGITAQRYIFGAYVDSLLNSAKPGQTVTFDFGEWNSLPKSVMQKLANKSGVNYVIKFKKNHKPVTVTIPAGTAIDLQYDWYGPDKMIQLYGLSQ